MHLEVPKAPSGEGQCLGKRDDHQMREHVGLAGLGSDDRAADVEPFSQVVEEMVVNEEAGL